MCAYSPGNQDISGQLMAQGISRFGDELQKGFQTYQQNKMLTAQSTAKFEGALRANPEILELFKNPNTPTPTDATKAFEKLQRDGAVGLKDAAILAQFADSYTSNKQQMQEQQMRQAQMVAAQRQAEQAQMEMENQKAAQAQLARAFAPSQPMGDAIQQGARFEQLQGVPIQGAQPTVMEAVRRFGQSGAMPTPAVNQFLGNALEAESRADAARMRQKEPPVGAIMDMAQIENLRKSGMDVDAVPLENGRFHVRKVSPFAPSPSTTVNLPPSETSFGKEAGRMSAERQMQEFTGAEEATKNISRIDQTIDLLKNGEPTTGVFAEAFNNMNRLRASFMADEKAGKKVTDTQVLDSLMGAEVFPLIGALGIGAKGMDTPAEREYLRKVMTGTIDLNKDTLLRMAKNRRDIAERAIKTFNEKVEEGEYDKFFEATGFRKKKVGTASTPTSSGMPDMSKMSEAQLQALINQANRK